MPDDSVIVAFTSPSERANANRNAFLLYEESRGCSIEANVVKYDFPRVYDERVFSSPRRAAPGSIVLIENGIVIIRCINVTIR